MKYVFALLLFGTPIFGQQITIRNVNITETLHIVFDKANGKIYIANRYGRGNPVKLRPLDINEFVDHIEKHPFTKQYKIVDFLGFAAQAGHIQHPMYYPMLLFQLAILPLGLIHDAFKLFKNPKRMKKKFLAKFAAAVEANKNKVLEVSVDVMENLSEVYRKAYVHEPIVACL